MSTKLVSGYTISQGDALGNKPLKGFKGDRVDPTTGRAMGTSVDKASDVAKNEIAKHLNKAVENDIKKTDPSVSQKTVDAGRTSPEHKGEKTEAKKHESNYQDVKAEANKLNQLASGAIKRPDAKQDTNNRGDARNALQQDHPQAAQNQRGPQASRNQNNAGMAASSSTPAMNAPKAKQAADLPKAPVGQDTAANALPQKAVKQAKGAESANIQQNPQFVAGQNIEKTKQQNLESADNIDEPEEEHVEGDKEEVASSPFMQARGASRKLDDMLGGLNTNVGAGGGDADASPGGGLEIAANKIETPGMLEETEEGKFPLADKLGVKILATDDSDKVVAARLAAQDYKENVEKLLKKYTSVDDKVENWRPDKGLVDRVIADTREQLDAAKSLIYAMRNGRGSPSGHGMSA